MTSPKSETMVAGPEFDDSVLRRLFDLAGPVQTAEILDRLNADLRAVLRVLAAFPSAEVAEVRRNIHTLIGISGTVGALHLHQLSLAAGKHLREAPEPDVPGALAPLVPLTEALLARLAVLRADH